MILEFSVPWVSTTNNVLLRMHWSKRRKINADVQWSVKAAIGRSPDWPTPPPDPVTVTIIRYGYSRPDRDNLYGGMKPLIDALTKCHLIIDDDEDHIVLRVRSAKIKRPEPVQTYVRLAAI